MLQILWEKKLGKNGQKQTTPFLVTMVNNDVMTIKITKKIAKWYIDRGISEEG